jgi:predicted RecA/RadA family phage recombinase
MVPQGTTQRIDAMATNTKFEAGDYLAVVATDPTSPTSGQPLVHGQRPGVALADKRSDGRTPAQFNGVFELSVVGANGSGSTAVRDGDILYYDSGEVNKDNANGIRYGYAYNPLATTAGGTLVTSGGTATISVIVGY